MSIKETDIRALVRDGTISREQFLYVSKRMSDEVIQRVCNYPSTLASDLGNVFDKYRGIVESDKNAIRAFSPVRACALYTEFLCFEPLQKESQRYHGETRADLDEFAKGLLHMPISLLRAEGGIFRGVEGQAVSELQGEASLMPSERRREYILRNKNERERAVRRQVGHLMQDSSGMALLGEEYHHMQTVFDNLVLRGGKTVQAPHWSPASFQGAQLGIELHRSIYPTAVKMFRGVVIK